MRRKSRICRHSFVGERSDNMLSQFGPGAANLEHKFGGIQVLWDYHTKWETTEKSTLYITIGVWQLWDGQL